MPQISEDPQNKQVTDQPSTHWSTPRSSIFLVSEAWLKADIAYIANKGHLYERQEEESTEELLWIFPSSQSTLKACVKTSLISLQVLVSIYSFYLERG